MHDQREIDAVVAVLQAPGRLAIGPEVAEFERRGAELLAKQHAVMVNSGTSALWLAVDLLGCEPGDEVITSPLTFSSDIAPLVRNGIVPAFVDVEPDTLQIDVDQDRGDDRPAHEGDPHARTSSATVPTGTSSAPSPTAHGLLVVEDSCDVLDSYLRGTRTGTRSDISVTSFARGHSITAASNGGMIAVDDPEWFDQTLVRRRWGRHSERYLFGSKQGDDDRFGTLADGTPYDMVFLFEDIGYNFEPSEIGAAYGNVQLDRLAEFNERRQQNFARLDEVLAHHEDKVVRARTTPEVDTTWMRFPFLLQDGIDRTAMQEFLLERGIPSRMVWTGNILRQPGFAGIAHRAPADGLPERRPGDGPRPHAAVAPRAQQRRRRPHRRVVVGLSALGRVTR